MSEVIPYRLTRSDLNKLGCNKESTPEKAYGVTRYNWKGFQVKSALGFTSIPSIYLETYIEGNYVRLDVTFFCAINDGGHREQLFEACLKRIIPEIENKSGIFINSQSHWRLTTLPVTEENVHKVIEMRKKIAKFVQQGIDKKSEVCLVD